MTTEEINPNDLTSDEVQKEPVIGPFKMKRKITRFLSHTGTRVRIFNEWADINASKFLGVDYLGDNIMVRMTICDEGTCNLEELETSFISKDQLGRLVEMIEEKAEYLQFTAEGKNFKLEIEYDKPVDILASLMEDTTEKPSEKGMSALDSLFELEGIEVEEEEVVVEDTTTKEEESKGENNVSVAQDMIAKSFASMNASKVEELKKKITTKEVEITKLETEVSFATKKADETKRDLEILRSRLDSFESSEPDNGWKYHVLEAKKATEIDPAIEEAVKKISPLLKLKEDVVLDYLKKSEYHIHIGKLEEGEVEVPSELLENLRFAFGAENIKLYSVKGGETVLTYSGELKWHDIVNKMDRKGFRQDSEFSKKVGSNSYGKDESEENENDTHSCGDDSCSGSCSHNSTSTDFTEGHEEFEEMTGYPVGNEFLFTVGEDGDGGVIFAINPKSYWDNEGCLFDGHIESLINVPQSFGEVMESTFEYGGTGTLVDAIHELISNGFKFNDDFHNFLTQHGTPVTVNGVNVDVYIKNTYPNSVV